MRHIRRAITVFVLLVMVTVSLAATLEVVRQGFPEPPHLEEVDLVGWLSTQHVRVQPLETQRMLIRRLEQDFRNGVDWNTKTAALRGGHWRQFDENFDVLMQRWFQDKVDRFFSLPSAERQQYVDDQIGNILHWRVVQHVPDPRWGKQHHAQKGEGRRRSGQDANASVLVDRMERLMSRMPPEAKQKSLVFLTAVKDRAIAHALKHFGPTQP